MSGCEQISTEEYNAVTLLEKKANWFCTNCMTKYVNFQTANFKLREKDRMLKENHYNYYYYN